MLTRRLFCGCLPLVAGFAATAGTALGAPAEPAGGACAVFSRERQRAETPASALERLLQGHERFLSGHTVNCDLRAQVKATAGGQAPFAAILGCMDSRVPVELVFDQRIGDVFVARVAGNFVNTDILGSLEYATRVAGARLVMVLGHSGCGAIKGAIDDVHLGNLTATLANIVPAVSATATVDGARSTANPHFVQAVAETNARLATRELTRRSDVMRDLVKAGELRIVTAMHDVATGRVSLLADA
jgi:carbonic anhydrase